MLVVALVGAVGFAVAGQIGAFVAIVGAAVLWLAFVLWAERK